MAEASTGQPADATAPPAPVNPRAALTIGATLLAGALLLVAVVAGLTATSGARIDSALGIAAGLIVILISLGGLAAVLSALGLSGHKEAFALPGGSVRSVLAFGILTALVFFAIGQFDSTFAPRLGPGTEMRITTTEVDPAKARLDLDRREAEQLRSLRALGAVVVPTGSDPATRSFVVFAKTDNAQGIDFAKQLLTMLGTLLTSVVSFYFGSRVAETALGGDVERKRPPEEEGRTDGESGNDARKDAGVGSAGLESDRAANRADFRSGAEDQGSADDPRARLADLRKRYEAAGATLDDLVALRDRAGERIAALPEGDRAAEGRRLTEAGASLDSLGADRKAAGEALDAADALATATAPSTGLSIERLTPAREAVGAFEERASRTVELREELVSLAVAEG